MKFVSDPPISTKIRQMHRRVNWQDPAVTERGIDQTRLVIDDDWTEDPTFSFLVIGDTGSGAHRNHNPQRQIAEQMLEHHDQCRFMIHTGDVIYLVGSREYYSQNFIEPYREFLVNGEHPERISYDQMTFKLPIFPVIGNHDYYDLPLWVGLLAQASFPFRHLFRVALDLDVGWHGSSQGKDYARAFMDCLNRFHFPGELKRHLDRHYTAKTDTGLCLRYQPGEFTRLPNRYYSFRAGGIDFFALDSNTFNAPLPLPGTKEGEAMRRQLERQRDDIERQRLQIAAETAQLNPDDPEEAERIDDLNAKLEQLAETKMDVDKQLEVDEFPTTDFEQLDWLRQRLIDSWNTEGVRGRVLFFHHPPYVTEATKWYQGQTLAVRARLRGVLDGVSKVVGPLADGRPMVDLVLTGHAHCMEHIKTLDTGHADSNIDWLVCGGSGFSLRRQRQEGPELRELYEHQEGDRPVAESKLFLGRTGHRSQKRRPYSFLRIDVQEGTPPKFVVRPFVSERYQRQWNVQEIEPFVI